MVAEVLVDERVEIGRELLDQLARDQFDVYVAFWARRPDQEQWRLYIASHRFNAELLRDAYSDFSDSLFRLPEQRLNTSEFKLLPDRDPMARAAVKIRDRQPGRLAVRLRDVHLGETFVQEGYIYPRSEPAGTSQIIQAIASWLIQPPPRPLLTFHLVDGKTIKGMPTAIQSLLPSEQPVIQLQTDGGHREISVAAIANVR